MAISTFAHRKISRRISAVYRCDRDPSYASGYALKPEIAFEGAKIAFFPMGERWREASLIVAERMAYRLLTADCLGQWLQVVRPLSSLPNPEPQ